MAYTAATKLPSLTFFQWSTPAAPNPRLAAPIDEDDTTLTFTSAPTDRTGAVITGGFLMNVTNQSGFTELIYVPTSAMSANGLTATGVIRGVRISGLDYTTGDSSFADIHEGDSPVGCAINAVYEAIVAGIFTGTIATSGAQLRIGTEADATVTLVAAGTTDRGFVRRDNTTSKAQFSNDGTTWTNFDSVSSSNLVTISAADTTAGYLSDKLVSATGGIDFNILNGGANETLNLTVDLTEVDIVAGPLSNVISDVTATATEINDALAGGSVTAADLTTLTAGAGSNADALHSHQNPAFNFVASEALTAGNAVALLPNEVQYYAQLTDANLALGDNDARRKHAVKFIPTVTVSTLTDIKFRAAEAVGGATATGTMTVSIQTDNAGQPSGTAVTNGTATFSQAVQQTWSATQGTRTATWAGNVTLVAGTTYWLVWEVTSTNAVNYINLSVNSSHDENYITFTRLTYDIGGGTWGTSTTNATPWFWGNTENVPLGFGLVPTDANWGARTFNFKGFAKATSAIGDTVAVYYDIVPSLTGIIPGKPYYLSTTAGAITTTQPSSSVYLDSTAPTAFIYRIGEGWSTTEVKIRPGNKRVTLHVHTGLTATTSIKYILWFKPELIKISGTAVDGTDGGLGMGFTNGEGTPQGAITLSMAAAGAETATSDTDRSIYTKGGAANYMVGTSSHTDIGFTYTWTETGAVTGSYYILECTA